VQNRVEKIEKILTSKNLEIMFARVSANLLKRDNIEEAIHICENGMKKFSTYAQGHYILARCYQKKGLADEARAEFERVLKFDPNHINALRELARIYNAAGLEDYYKDFLLRLFTIDPLNDEIVREVKKIGKYENWVIQDDSLLRSTIQKMNEEASEVRRKEEVASGASGAMAKKTTRPMNNLYERDKVDLSQFRNLQDDFTTILQGKAAGARPDEPQAAASGPVETKEKSEWVDDITYSYSDDKLPEQRETSAATKEEEEIETALKDLTFDEESDKIIEAGQRQAEMNPQAQISLDFPGGSISAPSNELSQAKNSEEAGTPTSAGYRVKPQVEKIHSSEPEMEIADVEEKKYTPGPHKELSLSAEEEEDGLPFKPPKIVSQTLGEILVSQKKYSEALEIFKTLKQKNPGNKNFDKKIEFLQKIIDLEKEPNH